MRLIDADKLKTDAEARIFLVSDTVGKLIDEQPTVEPVKHGKWISVKNELPKSNDNIRKEYIVCIDNTDVTTLDYDFLEKHFFGYDEGGYSYRATKVTHWMPLPKPPKE